MYDVNIEIRGDELSDIEFALDEIRRKISSGNLVGGDSNDEGWYNYEMCETTEGDVEQTSRD